VLLLALCHDPAVGAVPVTEPTGSVEAPLPGRTIITVDTVGTVVFALTAGLEAIVLRPWTETIGIAVALGLFLVGCLAFFAGYLGAIQRSRTDDISIADLVLLGGSTAPHSVRHRLNLLLIAQVVIAAATAAARPFTTLAFGVLAPVFGLGLNSLWAARHGQFPPRKPAPPRPPRRRGAKPASPRDPQRGDEMEQNANHG
jgi:hypothetical protein